MLTVYTRHTSKCPKKDNPTWRRCRCWKWIMGTVPGRPGSMRVSAKTRSWEQAESLARKYEITAAGGDEVKEARTLPTVTVTPRLNNCSNMVICLGENNPPSIATFN